MAPHFDGPTVQLLKRIMKQRPDHILTDEDYDRAIAETGMTPQQIQDWENNTRKNFKGEARLGYLDGDGDVVSGRDS